ncbi:MAG: surface lipoprotein assembly modifier [Pseudomonadota bacterium]
MRDATALTNKGAGNEAYALLDPQEVTRAGDPDFDLAFGIAANATAHYSRAIIALERVLAAQPENMQARAELGRALFAVGDTKAARELLQQSRQQGIPAAAGESVDQLLYAIDRVDALGKSSLKGYVELGVGHDSNANGGPSERNFAVPAFGGSVTIGPEFAKASGSFATAGAGLSGRYVLDPRWSVIGNANIAMRAYGGDADRFGTLQTDANLGVSYRVDRHELSLVVQGGTYDLDSHRERNIAGLVGEWIYRFDGFRQFGVYLQAGRMSYPQQHIADVDRTVLGVTYAHLTRSGLLAYGGVYAGQESERADGVAHLGHDLTGLRGGLQQALANNLWAFGTLGYEERRFGGTDPQFLVTRRDRQTNLTLGLSWVPAPQWRVTPQVNWTQVHSNVPTAAYDRTMLSLTARREF